MNSIHCDDPFPGRASISLQSARFFLTFCNAGLRCRRSDSLVVPDARQLIMRMLISQPRATRRKLLVCARSCQLALPEMKENPSMSEVRPKSFRAGAIAAILLGGAWLLLTPVVMAQSCDPTFCGLRWRMIGPFRAGRVNAVSGVVGQPETFYFGSVGGGVWKTNNAGRTWKPVFDSQSAASIGAIGVAPSDPNVVYVGTGEADMRDSIQFGDGMYKSTDGGKTWNHIGLENTLQIGRWIVDPNNPHLV